MKFTVADLLDQLTPDSTVPVAQLEKALGLSGEPEQQHLRIGLDGLVRLGLLEESEAGLQRRQDDTLIEARLRCSSKGFCFALRDDGGEDIYIRDHQLNHAWNGDRVLVRITREGGRRRSPEGGVQCILERATSSLLAQVEEQNDRLLAVPLDDRLLTSLELPSADAVHLDPSQSSVVEVMVDRYPVGQFAPQGHVERQLPIHGGVEADLDLLLTKHGLRERPAAPRATLRTPAPKDRIDLTAQTTLLLEAWSSEAPGLPALALEPREDGAGWRLWVHAPCVAERLALGSSLDLWLREQAEAFCVGPSWLPLLTPALAKASAFQPGRSESALSVALDLSPDGALEHYRFSRSTIRPTARVDLAALTALAERKPKARTVPAGLKALKDHIPLIEQLIGVAELLRQRRLAGGSIDLALPMPAIPGLGDLLTPGPDGASQGWMVDLPLQHPVALLREAVLLAHRALGGHLAALNLPALYAINPAAEASELNEVAKAALALEIPLELSAEGNASAAELAAAFAATDRSRVLQQQLRDTLEPVQISEVPGPNAVAGEELAVAPWCCPGLHYADLWNQQLLTSLLVDGKDRPTVRHKVTVDLASDACRSATIDWSLLTPSQLTPYQEAIAHGLAQRLQGRARFLQEVQSDALAMAQARQAEPLVGQVMPGVISGVQSYGFFVEVPPSQVEGLVHVSSLKDDWYEYRARQNRLVGRKNRRTYMLGDAVEVEIQKVDALRHQIDLVVLLPEGDDLTDSSEMTSSSGPDALGASSFDSPGFAASADGTSQFGADEDESSSDDDLSQD
ncbi:RNB domain-containing ribonuclease [Synechococcus sp. CCY9201]|uniref:RNB domain-containing ribonuclease n=1 Tax=Synechococcus sp. CCY9201 TaxID=174697 RepID=UPI002B1FC248|nr:RNB domain-containing ribonuclease [Synechococcus sp. CCY9201]MEA5473737.1 RNB domain-containing ribonuclease [Synechococcus sp. CCY9201]